MAATSFAQPSGATPPHHSARQWDADAIVVGSGPGGSATAAWLAKAGQQVLLLEKSTFPRDKVCGDGLTPRAVRQLLALGLPTSETDQWHRTKGLRIRGGATVLKLDWPEVADFPSFGWVRSRRQLDAALAEHAVRCGATLRTGHKVTNPVRDDTGRVIGVSAQLVDANGRATGETVTYHAPVVVACDGVSTRLAVAMGRPKRTDRPMGVAVRAYFETPRHDDEYLEAHIELWTKDEHGADLLMPGYGWLFGQGDGRSNLGLGVLDSSVAFGRTDYRDVMLRWIAGMPPEWGISEATMLGPIGSAALPMAFNRSPLYDQGLLLVGDAGGMVNPFNGEGIDYALEAGRVAAEAITLALTKPTTAAQDATLHTYQVRMKQMHGGYFMLGRYFARAIGSPALMRLAVKYGLPQRRLMELCIKLMANLPAESGGSFDDRLINLINRITPDA